MNGIAYSVSTVFKVAANSIEISMPFKHQELKSCMIFQAGCAKGAGGEHSNFMQSQYVYHCSYLPS